MKLCLLCKDERYSNVNRLQLPLLIIVPNCAKSKLRLELCVNFVHVITRDEALGSINYTDCCEYLLEENDKEQVVASLSESSVPERSRIDYSKVYVRSPFDSLHPLKVFGDEFDVLVERCDGRGIETAISFRWNSNESYQIAFR